MYFYLVLVETPDHDLGKAPEIAEWRQRTVKCAAWLNVTPPKLGRDATYIAKFMQPLLYSELAYPPPRALSLST